MLAPRLCWLKNECHSRLVNCDPRSEWSITLVVGSPSAGRRQDLQRLGEVIKTTRHKVEEKPDTE